MPLIINYQETSQIKEKYHKREDLEAWLIMHDWKIRKLDAELDGKPLAELIRMNERLIVVIDEENKKMKILNEIEFEDF